MLRVAEPPASRVLSAEEQRRLAEQEENTLRELRLFLREVTKRLATDKRFNIFSKPVDIEEVKWRGSSEGSFFINSLTKKVSAVLLKRALCVLLGVGLPGGDQAAHGPVHCHD